MEGNRLENFVRKEKPPVVESGGAGGVPSILLRRKLPSLNMHQKNSGRTKKGGEKKKFPIRYKAGPGKPKGGKKNSKNRRLVVAMGEKARFRKSKKNAKDKSGATQRK